MLQDVSQLQSKSCLVKVENVVWTYGHQQHVFDHDKDNVVTLYRISQEQKVIAIEEKRETVNKTHVQYDHSHFVNSNNPFVIGFVRKSLMNKINDNINYK